MGSLEEFGGCITRTSNGRPAELHAFEYESPNKPALDPGLEEVHRQERTCWDSKDAMRSSMGAVPEESRKSIEVSSPQRKKGPSPEHREQILQSPKSTKLASLQSSIFS